MIEFISPKEKPLVIPVFIPHMGCSNRCAFCDQKKITGTGSQIGEIEATVDNYLSFSKKRKVTELSFYGGSFTSLPFNEMMRYVEEGRKLVEKGKVDSLRCSARPDAINRDVVDILKKNGFKTIEIGVQTMSDKLLERMKRGHKSDVVFKSIYILKEKGLKTVVQLMTGYPYESCKDIEITLESLEKLKPDYLRIYPFVPLKGTEIYDDIENGSVNMTEVDTVIKRSAQLFITAMLISAPVIRIGLPVSQNIPDIYPHNISQIVVGKAIEMLAEKGETNFVVPNEYLTSFNMVRKKEKFTRIKKQKLLNKT